MKRVRTLSRSLAFLTFLFFTLLPASAQPKLLEFGFIGGIPLTNLAQTTGSLEDHSLRFTGGGVLQLNVPLGFALEADALYKRPGYRDPGGFLGSPESSQRSSQWEFPILAKLYPLGRNPVIQPYAGAGISFRRTNVELGVADTSATDTGLVVSAGVRNGPGRVKISPEIRYTRWFDATPLALSSQGRTANINRNQLEFLVAITF